jgi:hypothetical protein
MLGSAAELARPCLQARSVARRHHTHRSSQLAVAGVFELGERGPTAKGLQHVRNRGSHRVSASIHHPAPSLVAVSCGFALGSHGGTSRRRFTVATLALLGLDSGQAGLARLLFACRLTQELVGRHAAPVGQRSLPGRPQIRLRALLGLRTQLAQHPVGAVHGLTEALQLAVPRLAVGDEA